MRGAQPCSLAPSTDSGFTADENEPIVLPRQIDEGIAARPGFSLLFTMKDTYHRVYARACRENVSSLYATFTSVNNVLNIFYVHSITGTRGVIYASSMHRVRS